MDKTAEYQQLIEAQKQYRIDSHKSFCEETAQKLRPEFEDFFESEDMPMTEVLGEIYREKLRHIAKILKQQGIYIKK